MEQRVEIVQGRVWDGVLKRKLDDKVKKLAKEGWSIAAGGIAIAHLNGLLMSRVVATITFQRTGVAA